MPDWSKIAPKRADGVIDGLRKFANTAAKGYDVDPAHAGQLFNEFEQALADARAAYAEHLGEPVEHLGEPEEPASEPYAVPVEAAITFPHWSQIKEFVDAIPDKLFPAYALHFSNRMLRKSVGEDHGEGIDLVKLYGAESGPARRIRIAADTGE